MFYNAGYRIFILCNVLFVFKRKYENYIYPGYIVYCNAYGYNVSETDLNDVVI